MRAQIALARATSPAHTSRLGVLALCLLYLIVCHCVASPGIAALAQTQEQQQESPPPIRRQSPFLITGNTSGTLFENVLAVLQKSYYDQRFRKDELPKLASRYDAKAKRAKTLREERDVVQQFLSHIPASHLGLLSKRTYRNMINELQGRPYPTFGFQLVEIKGKSYACFVLEGGPAGRAGLLAWDRIVSIDGVATERSPRVDWRSDDAHIPDERDPPVHQLLASEGERIDIRVERARGVFLNISIPVEAYSAFAAAKASARIIKVDGHSFGYLHLWYIHLSGAPELLREKLAGEFRDCDGLILDLRGRGGNGNAIPQILDVLRDDRVSRRRPVITLLDRQSRSAKDVLAYELKRTGLARLVGERTAGAVIPATFADVGHETILMFPSFKLPRYTDLLELKPVDPDVFVERSGPFSGGDDSILKAGLEEAARLVKASALRDVVNVATFGRTSPLASLLQP
jgi:carboxyl-terminal processing protease